MKTVDLIVPCYNESEMIDIFYDTTKKIVSEIEGYSFNFIFIDDGSRDDTLKKVKNLASKHSNVKYIAFSRNFGKEAGMYAGLKASTGDRVAVIDADLQHPPELIKDMLYAIDEEGYDSCSARRVSREGEPKIRSAFSRLFYKLINKMSEVEIIDGAVDFRMMTRQMVDAILDLPEVQRFSKGIFCWVGFDTKWLPYKDVERTIGTSSWSFWGLFKYAIDGMTSFSVTPLRVITVMGIIMFLLFLLCTVGIIIEAIVKGFGSGFATIMCAMLFIGAILELSIGILGEYLGRVYIETKKRPIYLVKTANIEKVEK